MEPIRWGRAFALSWLVWLVGMAIGYGVAEWANRLGEADVPKDEAQLGDDSPETDGAEPPRADESRSVTDLFLFIFTRNVIVYVWLLAGLVSAGVITFMVLLANGILLGQAISVASWSGLSSAVIAELLVPHGVLELGTLCVAGAVGFQGFRVSLDWSRFNRELLKTTRLGAVLVFGVVALATAAGIEASVTGSLADARGLAK